MTKTQLTGKLNRTNALPYTQLIYFLLALLRNLCLNAKFPFKEIQVLLKI